jgi:hypothetical protein
VRKGGVVMAKPNLESLLLELGACNASDFKGMSIKKAWEIATANEIDWIVGALGGDPVADDLADKLTELNGFDLSDRGQANLARSLLPVPTIADLKQAIKADKQRDAALEKASNLSDYSYGVDYGTYTGEATEACNKIEEAYLKALPWAPTKPREE